ncbi:ImmA/IrrE family metallo-endopeptidase [Enterococcus thailandicus]|uniref:ImmA/IrrE family metallo-endopeptidase n=1 Tax=Enterococcus thailandicus TaxID=417368 RepID=UPI0022E5AE1D|nr:ImmA/IrrE family metallo-endopeptidase [Enterococcus thailandicus]
MESQINMIINELGVNIIEKEFLDANGHYIAEINAIVVKSSLSNWDKEKTILHELGHACKHHKDYYLYNLAFSLHSKMEHEADCYMIEKLLDGYLVSANIELSEVNYMKFIEDTDINPYYEPIVKNMLIERMYLYEVM